MKCYKTVEGYEDTLHLLCEKNTTYIHAAIPSCVVELLPARAFLIKLHTTVNAYHNLSCQEFVFLCPAYRPATRKKL